VAKAFAYVRLSSKEQLASGKDGFDRQINSIKNIAKRYGVDIKPENIYEDKGVSGYLGRNSSTGQLRELIDDIESLDIQRGDLLFVESIDRISRQRLLQTKDLVYDKILKKGVILITTSDGAKYELKDDPTEDFKQDLLLSVIAQRAHEESQIKSIRRKSAWQRAKKLAAEEKVYFNSHNPPYGIKFNPKTSTFEVDEEKANEIRMLFELLLSFGIKESVTRINKTNPKRIWTNRHVFIMLHSKYVIGSLLSQSRENGKKRFIEYIDNYYPQIISNTLYSSVKLALSQRRTSHHQGVRAKGNLNIFRHCVKCSYCGATMIFERQFNSARKPFFYFHCNSNREMKDACRQPRFRFDYLFGAFVCHIRDSVGLIRDIEEIEKFDFVEIVNSQAQKDKYLKIKNFFLSLTTKSTNDQFNKMLAELTEALNKKEELLDSFNRKIRQASESGISINELPLEFLVNTKKTQEEVDSLRSKVDELKIKLNQDVSDLQLNSHKEIIELFKTESGRVKINNYFIKQGLLFEVTYDKELRSLAFNLLKSGQSQHINYDIKFNLHKPLKKYLGFNEVLDIINEEEIL
jgi:DNA invertase Pin-like site-specific DNA recombinase